MQNEKLDNDIMLLSTRFAEDIKATRGLFKVFPIIKLQREEKYSGALRLRYDQPQ